MVNQSRQNYLFLPVFMITQDASEAKGRETGLLFPLALTRNSLLLRNCEYNSNPEENCGKQAAPLCVLSHKRVLCMSEQHVV